MSKSGGTDCAFRQNIGDALRDLPVTLRAVDHRYPVGRLQTKLLLSRLKVPFKRVNTADVEPDVTLLTQTTESKVAG